MYTKKHDVNLNHTADNVIFILIHGNLFKLDSTLLIS